MSCSTSGPTRVFALVQRGKIVRATFSRSLAKFVAERKGAQVQELVVERDPCGPFFAIVDARPRKRGRILRIALSQAEADLLSDGEWRIVERVRLVVMDGACKANVPDSARLSPAGCMVQSSVRV